MLANNYNPLVIMLFSVLLLYLKLNPAVIILKNFCFFFLFFFFSIFPEMHVIIKIYLGYYVNAFVLTHFFVFRHFGICSLFSISLYYNSNVVYPLYLVGCWNQWSEGSRSCSHKYTLCFRPGKTKIILLMWSHL